MLTADERGGSRLGRVPGAGRERSRTASPPTSAATSSTMIDRAGSSATSAATSRSPTSSPRSSARCSTSIPSRARPARTATASSSARATAPARSTRRSPTAASSRRAELATFMAPLSALNGHPNRTKVPGVETNTGPARARLPGRRRHARSPRRLRGAAWRTFVVLGDGELQEGSNWEAAMTAAHYGLDNLTRDRRPQPPAAGRAHRGDQAARAARRQVAQRSAGRSARSTATTTPRCSRPSRRRRTGKPGRRHRQHDQGQGRLVHGGPGRVAPQGARRRAGRRPRSQELTR